MRESMEVPEEVEMPPLVITKTVVTSTPLKHYIVPVLVTALIMGGLATEVMLDKRSSKNECTEQS